MSRVGFNPITIEKDVQVSINGSDMAFKGPKGELKLTLPEGITADIDGETINVKRSSETKAVKSLHGTFRSLIANQIKGVKDGYQKKLEVSGVGYRVKMNGVKLEMTLGWNHPVFVEPPMGITFETPDEVTILVSGIDKELVGKVAARVREYRKTEPYKGKGIKYEGEYVRRKSAKKSAA